MEATKASIRQLVCDLLATHQFLSLNQCSVLAGIITNIVLPWAGIYVGNQGGESQEGARYDDGSIR